MKTNQTKISIILTAWREEKTIGKAIEAIINDSKLPEKYEFIVLAPDDATIHTAEKTFHSLRVSKDIQKNSYYKIIKDPGKGKPHALNMAFKRISGEIIVFTDGDIHLGPDSINHLLVPFQDKEVGGVTGRPVSQDSLDYMMGYFGNLLADAAHHKRMVDLTDDPQGVGKRFVHKRKFFPMSGYIMAVRSGYLNPIPEDALSDDAYISYMIFNNGGKIAYAPEAKAYVKYATKMNDYFKQKKRSLGGFTQLWKYGIVKAETKSRSFWHELEYFWFPIKYAKSLKQLMWSLLLYPIRLWLWFMIWFERKFINKSFEKTWVRVESTK